MAIVGTDCVAGTYNYYGYCPDVPDPATGNVVGAAEPFYFSRKHQLFMYNENDPYVRYTSFPE